MAGPALSGGPAAALYLLTDCFRRDFYYYNIRKNGRCSQGRARGRGGKGGGGVHKTIMIPASNLPAGRAAINFLISFLCCCPLLPWPRMPRVFWGLLAPKA